MQLNNETINGLVSALNLKCALCELYASCFSIRRVIIYIYIYIYFLPFYYCLRVIMIKVHYQFNDYT